jgi:hypothetical protein
MNPTTREKTFAGVVLARLAERTPLRPVPPHGARALSARYRSSSRVAAT